MADALLETAKKAVQELFGDDSVSPAKTRERLEEIAADCESYLDTLEDD